MIYYVGLLVLAVACGLAMGADAPKVGDLAPDVGATDENGKEIRLSSFKGKSGVVVYFYPKADTPGCTKESCGFRDELKTFSDKGYAILGVSRDGPEAQKAFKEKYQLNFPLLSDPKGELAAALGVTPGKRQTVVLDKEGKVERLYGTVEAATHAKDLLKDLGQKQQGN
ncbi:MAG: peroxiredoxin [Planctomycetota bacterium]